MKLIHTKDGNIYFGISLQDSRIFKGNSIEKNRISYKIVGGKGIYGDGILGNSEVADVQRGQMLNITIDHMNGTVEWWISGVFYLKQALP